MLKTGILNPGLLALLAKFRHTVVIADRGFPYWPQVPTIDTSLVDDIPSVRQVLAALLPLCTVGGAWMPAELKQVNPESIWTAYQTLLAPAAIVLEPTLISRNASPPPSDSCAPATPPRTATSFLSQPDGPQHATLGAQILRDVLTILKPVHNQTWSSGLLEKN